MHVLGITGSPRVNGNTDVLLDELLTGVRSSGGTIDKVYLFEKDVKACSSCYSCLSSGACSMADDMVDISRRMVEADGIILASPVYWNCVSGQMKVFLDRCLVFMNDKFESKLAGKLGGFVITCGAPDPAMTDLTKSVLEFFFSTNSMNMVDGIIASSLRDPGDALKNGELMAKAFQAGRKFI